MAKFPLYEDVNKEQIFAGFFFLSNCVNWSYNGLLFPPCVFTFFKDVFLQIQSCLSYNYISMCLYFL